MTTIGQIEAFGESLSVVEQRYPDGGLHYSCVSDCGEPYGTLSKRLPGTALAEGEVLMKTYSENEPMRQPLLASGLFEDTGRRVPSGFVDLEVWRRK